MTRSSPIVVVRLASMVALTSVFLKSSDTSGSSVTAMTFFIGPAAASFRTPFTSSANVFLLVYGDIRHDGRCW